MHFLKRILRLVLSITPRFIRKLLLTLLDEENTLYYSPLTVKDLKETIRGVLESNSGAYFSVNLSGKFISDHHFEITPKWQFLYIQYHRRAEAYLYGEIFSDISGRTCVRLSAESNALLLIVTLLSPVIGLTLLVTSIVHSDTSRIFPGILLTTLVPLISYHLAAIAKKSLKSRFVLVFELQKTKSPITGPEE